MHKVLTFLICFLFVSNTLANGIERAQITYKGTKGFFFSEEIATEILIDLEDFNAQSAYITLLDTKLELMDEKVLLLERGIELANGISDKYKANYTAEHQLRIADQKHYADLLNKKTAWYKSPGLWFGVGFLIAGSLAVGLSFSLQETRE